MKVKKKIQIFNIILNFMEEAQWSSGRLLDL